MKAVGWFFVCNTHAPPFSLKQRVPAVPRYMCPAVCVAAPSTLSISHQPFQPPPRFLLDSRKNFRHFLS